MGIQGFSRWIENNGINRSGRGSSCSFDHVCWDMNSLLHCSYDPRQPTVEATLQSLLGLCSKLLVSYQAKESLAVVFDGPAPTSKLETQRERRRKQVATATYLAQQPGKGAKQKSGTVLHEAHITTGSTFLWMAELQVEKLIQEQQSQGGIKAQHVFMSPSTVPGEGETKIFQYLQRSDEGRRDHNDTICIIGNDSDLVLGSIACLNFHNFFVVNPNSFAMTCVGDLLHRWILQLPGGMKEGLSMLPIVRIDIVFIWLLAGCDHYPGVGEDIMDMLRRYYTLRGMGAGKKKRDATTSAVPIVSEQYRIHTALLRELIRLTGGGKGAPKDKSKRARWRHENRSHESAEPGLRLIEGALWSLATLVSGECPHYAYQFQGSAPKLTNLSRALSHHKDAKVPRSVAQPLVPLQSYVSMCCDLEYMPPTVRKFLEIQPKYQRVMKFTSSSSVCRLVQELFADINDYIETSKRRHNDNPKATEIQLEWTEDETRMLQHGTAFTIKGMTRTSKCCEATKTENELRSQVDAAEEKDTNSNTCSSSSPAVNTIPDQSTNADVDMEECCSSSSSHSSSSPELGQPVEDISMLPPLRLQMPKYNEETVLVFFTPYENSFFEMSFGGTVHRE